MGLNNQWIESKWTYDFFFGEFGKYYENEMEAFEYIIVTRLNYDARIEYAVNSLNLSGI